MNVAQWQAEEDKYLVAIQLLEEQENWAKAFDYPLLARTYSEGARQLLNELSVIQKLRSLDK